MDESISPSRSANMAKIGSRNTKPELVVRSFLHKRGLRYRLHDRKLPGTPDLVLKKYRTVVFVNGCFWHGHEGCRRARLPGARREFWAAKIEKNKQRDQIAKSKLTQLKWRFFDVWTCATSVAELDKLYKMIIVP